jgi:hypothetical protein
MINMAAHSKKNDNIKLVSDSHTLLINLYHGADDETLTVILKSLTVIYRYTRCENTTTIKANCKKISTVCHTVHFNQE